MSKTTIEIYNLVSKKNITAFTFILAAAILGTVLILGSHAASPYASSEAESGTLGGVASVGSDSTASGSKYVQFGSVSSLNGQMGISAGTWAFTYEGLSSSAQQTAINNMVADGVKWLRVDVDLNNGDEPLIKAVQTKGISVDAILQASDGTTTTTPSSMASLATHEVSVLKPLGVETYEVLNEPNDCAYQLSASDYTAILKSVYTTIKAEDPNASVIAGGLCPNSGSNEPYTYVSAMYSAGAHGYFDALNDHAYTGAETPLQTSDPTNPWSYLPQIHQTMVDNGDGNKPIWITEFGCPTGSANDGFPVICTEDQLATQITDAYQQVKSMSYIGPLFIYDWQDGIDDFGLYNSDGTPKTAPLAAFTAAANNN
jgi:hypothetical protein